MSDDTISIFALEDTADGDRGWIKRDSAKYERAEIPTTAFSERVGQFLTSMSEVLSKARSDVAGFELHEVTVTAEVSAKGTVSILGCGGEVAGKGAMEFKFVRRTGQVAANPPAETPREA